MKACAAIFLIEKGNAMSMCCFGKMAGRSHNIDCIAVAKTQPHAMVNDEGEVFYPDSPEDAAYFAEEHGAVRLAEMRGGETDGESEHR